MKLRYFVLSISVAFFMVSLLSAQAVQPASLTIEAIPGDTSPRQKVQFTNTGDVDLTLTISISGPFAIPKNECGHPVKQNLHCDVWVTYSPEVLGTDSGTLTFTFNDQSVSVPLTGDAMDLLPTRTQTELHGGNIKTIVSAADGYHVPSGDQVQISCTAVSGPYKGYGVGATSTLQDGVALTSRTIVDVLNGHYMWRCSSSYNGDSEFGPSGSGSILVWSSR